MKNKDKYDLSALAVEVSYMVNGCGKKLDGLRYITIRNGSDILLSETINGHPIERIMRWLEEDAS